MKKKFAKIFGVGVTIALVASLMVIAAPVVAQGPGTLTKTITLHADNSSITCINPMSGIVDFQFDYTSPQGTAPPEGLLMVVDGPAPYVGANDIDMLFYFPGGTPSWDPASEKAMMEMGIVDWDEDDSIEDDCVLVYTGDTGEVGPAFTITFSLDTTKNWSQSTDKLAVDPDYTGIDPDWNRPAHTSVWPMGACCPPDHSDGKYHITSTVLDSGGQTLDELEQDEPLYNEPYMMPSLGVDVKGSVQCFYAKNTGPDVVLDWAVLPGVHSPNVTIESGGEPEEDWICISAAIPGDAIVKCYIDMNQDGVYLPQDDLVIGGEKKWGDIHHTELDAEKTTAIEVNDTVDIDEMVYATIHWGSMDPEDEVVLPAGGALVHWWLVENTDNENQQALIDLLEDDIFEGETVVNNHPYYDICGQYNGFEINPFELINTWCTAPAHEADFTQFIAVEGSVADPQVPDTYVNSVSDDSMPWETTGWTQTTIDFYAPDSDTLMAEEVMVVLLVEYPIINMFHGENPVCVEFVKLTPKEKVPPAQVKIPQVRWAGEKIVLEKEWGTDFYGTDGGNLVMFALEEGSIGDLIPCYPEDLVSSDSRTVFTSVKIDGVARVMFKTEQQGQVDVECVLYDYLFFDFLPGDLFDAVAQTIWDEPGWVIGNHGFIVYYLAFEEILWPAETIVLDAGEELDPIPCVSGWFTSDALPGTLRPEREQDVNNDGVNDFLLPAGRYVLPFDWPLLAGFDLEARPWYDLMDSADLDNVVSLNPLDGSNDEDDQLGPWVNVNSTDGEADFPSIGPFSTLQQWSLLDLWIADATVPADLTVAVTTTVWDGNDLRNTVVPNEILDWFDAPMSQALGEFEIVDGTVADFAWIEEWDKGDFWPYGHDPVTFLFNSPFYEVEIPSHWLIPAMKGAPMGYMWDSWPVPGGDGPYNYWDDLDATVTAPVGEYGDIIEVYGDNHSYFGCHINAPEDGGVWVDGNVILQFKVDYPYLPCKFPAVTSTIEIIWGPPEEHLDADFEVDPRIGEAPITVTFYGLKAEGTGVPWTQYGTPPYVKAEWDFDGDGTIDTTVEGATSALTLATQTFEFTSAGTYSPSLTVTDSNAMVDTCTKPDYIVLNGGAPGMKGDFDADGDIDLIDFAAFGDAYDSVSGDANYDVIGDFDDDGDIDLVDFAAFGDVYGYGT